MPNSHFNFGTENPSENWSHYAQMGWIWFNYTIICECEQSAYSLFSLLLSVFAQRIMAYWHNNTHNCSHSLIHLACEYSLNCIRRGHGYGNIHAIFTLFIVRLFVIWTESCSEYDLQKKINHDNRKQQFYVSVQLFLIYVIFKYRWDFSDDGCFDLYVKPVYLCFLWPNAKIRRYFPYHFIRHSA